MAGQAVVAGQVGEAGEARDAGEKGEAGDVRIRSTVEPEDALNDFRRGRRGTNNVLILNNAFRHRMKTSGAHVIIIDFSKTL